MIALIFSDLNLQKLGLHYHMDQDHIVKTLLRQFRLNGKQALSEPAGAFSVDSCILMFFMDFRCGLPEFIVCNISRCSERSYLTQ